MLAFACCWMIVRPLFQAGSLPHPPECSLGRCVAAALGFLCFNTGCALTIAGRHVFDRVMVADRWSARPATRPTTDEAI